MGNKIRIFVGVVLILIGLSGISFFAYEAYFSDNLGNVEKRELLDDFKSSANYIVPPDPVVEDGVRVGPERQYVDPPENDTENEYLSNLGILHVPSWDKMQIPIREGSTRAALKGAAGHYPTTENVGQIGNFAVSAHRRSHGSNFRRIEEMKPGEQVVVETDDIYYVYKVYETEVVDPSNVDVLLPVPHQPETAPTKRIMTMTTCHPEWGNSERFVVYSELEYWVWKNDGVPEPLW